MENNKSFIKSILLFPIMFIRSFFLGVYFVLTTLIDLVITPIYNVIFYAFISFVLMSYYTYKIFSYAFLGIKAPFILYNNMNYKKRLSAKEKLEQERLRKEQEEEFRLQQQKRAEQERNARLAEEREKAKQFMEASKAAPSRRKTEDYFTPEEDRIGPKTLGDRINDFLEKLVALPSNLSIKIKDLINNSIFVKSKRNEKLLNQEVLLLNLDGEDAIKSEEKQLYEYTGKDADGKYVKGYFEAFSKVEVHSFLISEGMEVYSIETSDWIQFLHGHEKTSNVKFKNKDLIFFLTQLSTYIKAGIPLVEALKILSRQYKKKSYKKIFRSMIYELSRGETFSAALESQGNSFPRLLINMVKTSEMTGELPAVLDEQANYYTEVEKTRKAMINAITYPVIILVFAIGVAGFIMVGVVPKFVEIFESMDAANVPAITVFIMKISTFLQYYWWVLILGIFVFIGIAIYLYKNVVMIRMMFQAFAMRLPVIGNVIIYNEVTIFTKTFSTLLSHNVFITDSMEILNKITNNEVYKALIKDTIVNLAKGDKISKAFENHWAFPIPAYEMLVTGEKTGDLPEMMAKVADYYQELHSNSVTRIKTFIEPILIVLLTGIVGIIVLSIIVPMFELYNNVDKM